jgi:hypothetical protein
VCVCVRARERERERERRNKKSVRGSERDPTINIVGK